MLVCPGHTKDLVGQVGDLNRLPLDPVGRCARSVGWSTTLVQTEISELLDGSP